MINQCQNQSERFSKAVSGQDFLNAFRGRYVWILLGSVLITSQLGCSSYHLAKRTMYCELNEYPQVTDGKLACRKYRGWAKQEWQRVRMESGDTFSDDYASGFLQGFVDQVYAGGKPVAPPVPPRKYGVLVIEMQTVDARWKTGTTDLNWVRKSLMTQDIGRKQLSHRQSLPAVVRDFD